MNGTLTLYLPEPEELWFYQTMLSDPATMSYNAPWFPPDGCIPFPREKWADWHAAWVDRAPERFYAYLRRREDGAFVGGVHYYRVPERDRWDIGVLIYAPERGKGYGRQGLAALLDRAFRTDGIVRLHNEFELTRSAALSIHLALGFRETGRREGQVFLELTKKENDALQAHAEGRRDHDGLVSQRKSPGL